MANKCRFEPQGHFKHSALPFFDIIIKCGQENTNTRKIVYIFFLFCTYTKNRISRDNILTKRFFS